MKNSETYNLLRYIVIFGNILFILWILYNGINEGFRATIYQKISYFGLITLLVLNSILVYDKLEHKTLKMS